MPYNGAKRGREGASPPKNLRIDLTWANVNRQPTDCALCFSRSAGRWLLKGPGHLMSLPALFAEYPDARVVVTHRDPLKVMPSMVDLVATLQWQRCDHVDYNGIVQRLAIGYPYVMNQMMEQRRSGAVPEERIIDVNYDDLVTDPVAAVTTLYDQLGTAISQDGQQRIRDYLSHRRIRGQRWQPRSTWGSAKRHRQCCAARTRGQASPRPFRASPAPVAYSIWPYLTSLWSVPKWLLSGWPGDVEFGGHATHIMAGDVADQLIASWVEGDGTARSP